MIERNELAEIGKFQKTHALKGELNALLEIDVDYVDDGNPLVVDVDGIFVPFYAESIRPKGTQSYLIKLEGVDSEEQAKAFVNCLIYAPKVDLIDYFGEEGEEIAFDDDLVGYIIHDSEKGDLGTVIGINDSTDNVLLIGETPAGEEFFIPLTPDFIDEIDDERNVIFMTLPEGLLDLN